VQRVVIVPGLAVRRYLRPARAALRRRGIDADLTPAPGQPGEHCDLSAFGRSLGEQLRGRPVDLLVGQSVGAQAAAVAAAVANGSSASGGVRHLVLFGRSKPSAAARAAVDRLHDQGVDVRVVSGDVTSEQDVSRAIKEASPLAGVVHAAGVLDDGPLAEQTPERFAAALRAKVHGGHLLDRLSRPLQPRFFVAYSSLAAVVPTRGSGAYGAANAYLDGLMAARRSQGLPGISVAWGPWAGPGMASGEAVIHEAMGLRMIDPAAGTATLLTLLSAPDVPARVVVAPADWSQFRDALAQACPPGFLDAVAAPAGVPEQGPARRKVRIEDPAALREHVVSVVSDVLRISGPVDDNEGFFDMGFDSLMVLELRTRLQADLGVRLPSTVAFTFPTVDRLVERLRADLGLDAAAPPRTAPVLPSPPDDDGELAAMLARVERGYRQIQDI